MKKVLSVLLVMILLLSSVWTGAWALDNSVPAGTNLMKDYTYKNWSVTNRATINAPTESFSGDTSNAFSVTKLMWRSAYTKIALEAGETYELKFYYKEENPSQVYLTDNNNRGVLMAPTSAMAFGDEITLVNNDYSNNLLNDLNYNIPSDKDGWNIVTAVISPSVTGEHTFGFTGAAPDVNDLSIIHFSDFSLVKQGEDPNVLANTKASDWVSGWNGNTGESVNDAIAVKTAWRSGYTKVTLKPNTEYDFTFNASTVKISDVRVYPASEITSNTQLTFPACGGNLPGGTTNLAAGAFSSTAPAQDFATATPEVVNAYYTVSESFTTTNETEYYIVLDCTQFLNNGAENIYCTFVHLKDLSLVAKGDGANEEPNLDPNVLNDNVMAGLTWNAIWNTGLRNPKDATLDKSQSYSGTTYAMTFGRNSRYRDNYAVVTLEPNTTYDFSFRYKSGTSDERIEKIGFVDASKVDMTTYKGDFVKNHRTDASAPLLGESEANIERELGGVWNLVSTTFTTGTAKEYIMYIYVGEVVADQSFTTMTLSDFSLVAQENEDDDQPEDPNALNDTVMKNLTWSALWASTPASSKRDPKTAELDKSQSYSGNAYAMTWGGASRYRDNYTVVTLEPNTTYNFSFRYKSGTAQERVEGIGFVDASKVNLSTVKTDRVLDHRTDTSAPILGKTEAVIGNVTDGSWNEVTTTFTTTDSKEYIMYLAVTFNGTTFSALTLSDFSLVAEEGQPEQPGEENALENSKATDWFSSWSGATGTNAGEAISVRAAYRSAYTKVTLKPNTKYKLSFSHGEVRVTDIRVFAASEITDPASQLMTPDSNGGPAPGGTNNLAIDAVSTTCPATPVAGEFYTSSESFTTTNETEYYIFLDCGAFSTTAILLKDLTLVPATEDVNPDSPVLQLINVENWNSTWRLQGANINITKSTDSFEGGEAVSVDKSNYRSTFVKLNLAANTKYKLTFNYKGKSAVSNLHLIALNDIDSAKYAAKPDQLINALKTGIGSVFTQSYSTLKYDGNTWNKVSANFKTNNNTEYYLVFENNTAGSGFVASDFAVEIDTTPDDNDDDNEPDPNNILVNTKPSDWTSSWGPATGVLQGNAISLRAAYRSAYTKVTLKPNITYHFNFKFEHVKVTDIRVYDAAEITDLNTQMVSGENGGAVIGGKRNLAADSITTDCGTPEPNKVYSAFEAFTTTSATEYYIILDFAMGDGVSNNILLKNLSLKKYYDPTTDIFGTISGGMGGSVTNKGEQPYEKGKETTVKATPLSGNKFEGWYDDKGNKVSSNASYTFTVEKEFDLLAKFSGPNMPYVDWLKENGIDGTFENGSMPGWYAVDEGTGVIATWASYNPISFASHSGNKAMAMIARYQHSYFHFDNLSKNSDYYLSYYIYCPDLAPYNPDAEIGRRGFKVNEMYVSVGDDTIWSKTNVLADGNNGWHKIEFFFNTGNADTATLCINYYGDVNIAEKAVYLDDITFVQYMADALDNGDFSEGNTHWMGDYSTATDNGNTFAEISKGKKIYQSVATEPHSRYTISFRAKGELLAAASKINKYSTGSVDLISSVTSVTTAGEWNEYTFDVYTGMNSAINLVFEALADGAEIDDIKIIKQEDSTDAVVEKIDFETDRFAIKNSTTNKDVFEIYEGTEFARSGNKSLHFKYNAADSETEYVFNESYLGFQISNKRVYRLTFYYKTSDGSTIKISPDFLGNQAGNVGVKHTAKGNGWNRVDFFASSSSAIYFDPIIANIVDKTKADFYVDDITYTIVSAAVLETNIKNVYAEPPLALLYNEGFEEPITSQNWGKLPATTKVVTGDTEFGNKYLKVNGKTFYVLPVAVEAGVQYYFSASLRGTGGYIGLSISADGKSLFTGISGEKESFIKPTSKKWQRSGFKFSAPMSGVIYLVIDCDKGYLDVDNVLIYKENYALETKPNGHDILTPYNYTATTGKNYILNGGYTADGGILGEDSESPATGDNFPAATLIIITFIAAVLLLASKKFKKEAK